MPEKAPTTAAEKAPRPQISIEVPEFITECKEIADLIAFGFKNENREVQERSKTLFSRLLLVESLLHSPDRDLSTFDIVSNIHSIGKELASIIKLQIEKERKEHQKEPEKHANFTTLSACAAAFNKKAEGLYSVFVPIEGSAFNGLEMTGGTSQELVREVLSWGVRNRRGDTERKAIVR